MKRYVVRNIVDAASLRDISEAAAIDGGSSTLLQTCTLPAADVVTPLRPPLGTRLSADALGAYPCCAAAATSTPPPPPPQQPQSPQQQQRPTCAHYLRVCVGGWVCPAPAGYALPKLYHKMYFSISAAIHSHYVRVRSREGRRNREPPKRFAPRRDDDKKKEGAAGAPKSS